MAKCFLTGIDLPLQSAFILDQGAARRALRSLKERVAAMERLLAQFTPKDSVQVYNPKTRTAVTRSQSRLACQSVAEALSALYPETRLFVLWPEYLKRHRTASRTISIPSSQASSDSTKTPRIAATTAPAGNAVIEGQGPGQNNRPPQPVAAPVISGSSHVSS
jgi:hypothetical protein